MSEFKMLSTFDFGLSTFDYIYYLSLFFTSVTTFLSGTVS